MRIMLDVPNRKDFRNDLTFAIGALLMLKADKAFLPTHDDMANTIRRLEDVVLQIENKGDFYGKNSR